MKRSYVSAEKFILSREFFGMKLGLENISQFLESIGSPQTKYDTIHVAGTNGKGSTAAMLASILQKAGYKTGLFTSPHLVSLRERVQVNGRMISQPSLTTFVNLYRKELCKRKLSFFEVVTALALYYFERTRVDIAVIETGLGGRLDATNVLVPRLTITTDIDFDHMEILGSTLRKIAWEKAGIIKKSVPHLMGLIAPEPESVITKRCRELRAPLHKLTKRNFVAQQKTGKLDFKWNGYKLHGLFPSLLGPHQLKNSALVVKAASILDKTGLKISHKAISEGLSHTRWPGRFHVIEKRGRPSLVLDVCHNVSGVRALVDSFKIKFPERKAFVITGFVKRKSHQLIFDVLSEISRFYALVPLKTNRSTDLVELIRVTDFGNVPQKRFGSLKTAYRKLLKELSHDDTIVVAGSHYLVGEFLKEYGCK